MITVFTHVMSVKKVRVLIAWSSPSSNIEGSEYAAEMRSMAGTINYPAAAIGPRISVLKLKYILHLVGAPIMRSWQDDPTVMQPRVCELCGIWQAIGACSQDWG